METIKICESNRTSLSFNHIKDHLTQNERFCPLNEFRNKLEGGIYNINVEVTRFILCKIEENFRTRENITDLWKKEKDKYIFTIEHIFPKADKIPKEWVNMVAEGNLIHAKKIQSEHVHKLGNLTISGYNPNLATRSFAEKMELKDSNSAFIGYKNGFYLNRNIVNKTKWTKIDFEEETKELIDLTLSLFKIDGK